MKPEEQSAHTNGEKQPKLRRDIHVKTHKYETMRSRKKHVFSGMGFEL